MAHIFIGYTSRRSRYTLFSSYLVGVMKDVMSMVNAILEIFDLVWDASLKNQLQSIIWLKGS